MEFDFEIQKSDLLYIPKVLRQLLDKKELSLFDISELCKSKKYIDQEDNRYRRIEYALEKEGAMHLKDRSLDRYVVTDKTKLILNEKVIQKRYKKRINNDEKELTKADLRRTKYTSWIAIIVSIIALLISIAALLF